MSSYRVTAPYVTLKVKDANGQEVLLGYYKGAVVADPTDEEQVKAHLDLGMLEKVSAATAAKSEPSKSESGKS